jgi:hypothetical protein
MPLIYNKMQYITSLKGTNKERKAKILFNNTCKKSGLSDLIGSGG